MCCAGPVEMLKLSTLACAGRAEGSVSSALAEVCGEGGLWSHFGAKASVNSLKLGLQK